MTISQGCPLPDSPRNGYVNVSEGVVAGNKIHYSCKEGYVLVGAASRICEDDSTWSNLEPTCHIREWGTMKIVQTTFVMLLHKRSFFIIAIYCFPQLIHLIKKQNDII